MITHLPKLESSTAQQSEPVTFRLQGGTPEPHTVITVELDTPADLATQREVVALRCTATRRLNQELPVDLVREGANMLELQARQSRCMTPLSISSKATQNLLRQF
jgi:hypothetical protein